MRIEVSFAVDLTANIAFDVDPGTVLTEKMLDDAISAINRSLEDSAVTGGNAKLYAQVIRRDKQIEITAYDSVAGADFTPEIGKPVDAAPAEKTA